MMLLQVYLSEISSPGVRGAIGASSSVCFTLGVVVAYLLGSWRLAWPSLAAVGLAPPLLSLLALGAAAESPVWLAAQGRAEQARRTALWLHGTAHGAPSLDEYAHKDRVSFGSVLRSLASRHTARPMAILLAFFFFQQFCGMNAVVFYAVAMFQESGVSAWGGEGGLDSHQSAVVIGATRFLMTALTCLLLARVGRRPLSLVSGLGMATAMFTLGTALHVQQLHPNPALVLPCLAAFIAANTVGFFAVPWVMLGELLPERSRGAASGLAAAIAYAFVFIVVKSYPPLLLALGQAGVFWVYGAVSLGGTFFVLAMLPETHGKTLDQIEAYFP